MQSSDSQVIKRFKKIIDSIHEKRIFHSKKELTEAIGLNSSKLSMTNAGKRKLEYHTLYELKKKVPIVNLNWLFSGVGPMFLDENHIVPEGQQEMKDEILSLRTEIKGLRALMSRMELTNEIDINSLSVEEKAAYMVVLLQRNEKLK